MFPSYTTSSLKFLPSQKHWRCSLLPYPFNQSPNTVSLFVKRNKNVNAPKNTISLFSSSRRQDAVRVLSVSHVRFPFLHHNQSNMVQPGPIGPRFSREIPLLIWPRCSLSPWSPRENVNHVWQSPFPSSTSWPFFHLQGYKNEGNLLRLIHMAWELLAGWFHSLAISCEEI